MYVCVYIFIYINYFKKRKMVNIYVYIYTHILYACVNIWYVKNLHVVTHVVDGVACLI